MKKIFYVLILLNFNFIHVFSVEPDVFVQSTVNRASEILAKNISQEEKTILDKVYKRVIKSLEELNSKKEDFIINELNSFDKDKI